MVKEQRNLGQVAPLPQAVDRSVSPRDFLAQSLRSVPQVLVAKTVKSRPDVSPSLLCEEVLLVRQGSVPTHH